MYDSCLLQSNLSLYLRLSILFDIGDGDCQKILTHWKSSGFHLSDSCRQSEKHSILLYVWYALTVLRLSDPYFSFRIKHGDKNEKNIQLICLSDNGFFFIRLQ